MQKFILIKARYEKYNNVDIYPACFFDKLEDAQKQMQIDLNIEVNEYQWFDKIEIRDGVFDIVNGDGVIATIYLTDHYARLKSHSNDVDGIEWRIEPIEIDMASGKIIQWAAARYDSED